MSKLAGEPKTSTIEDIGAGIQPRAAGSQAGPFRSRIPVYRPLRNLRAHGSGAGVL
jgi:hypothetical protein